jgi:hypothetical protein
MSFAFEVKLLTWTSNLSMKQKLQTGKQIPTLRLEQPNVWEKFNSYWNEVRAVQIGDKFHSTKKVLVNIT